MNPGFGGGGSAAVVGGGPAGLVAAKHLLEQGLDPVVFERGEELGGQWNVGGRHSAAWPGMRANTSKTMTAFSDFPPPRSLPMFPRAEQVHAYLRAYAERFGVAARVRTGARVVGVERRGAGWRVAWTDPEGRASAEDFEAVVLASGRFSRPRYPFLPGLDGFARRGRVLHSRDYRVRDEFRGLRVVVYGNGASGLEIASELAADDSIAVVSACARPRYVLPKVHRGLAVECLWFTRLAALRGRALTPRERAAEVRRVASELAGEPAAFGGLAPDPDILATGVSQCQQYLPLVAEGRIETKPRIAMVEGDAVRFADRSTQRFDAIVCATGYDLDLSYLAADARAALGADRGRLRLYKHTLHPDLPRLGLVGQLVMHGPYLPVLELQARWLAAVWAGALPGPAEHRMRVGVSRCRRPAPRRPPYDEVAGELWAELRPSNPTSPAAPTDRQQKEKTMENSISSAPYVSLAGEGEAVWFQQTA